MNKTFWVVFDKEEAPVAANRLRTEARKEAIHKRFYPLHKIPTWKQLYNKGWRVVKFKYGVDLAKNFNKI